MNLTSEQKQNVAAWVAAGATLNEIQDRLKSELGVVLTFMDTRFLLTDLGLTLQPPPGEEDDKEDGDEGELGGERLEEPGADWVEDPEAAEAPSAPDALSGGPVRVTVDVVTVPGTMASGKVTFSDGVSGGWYLDQMGQLGLTGIPRTYQPPEADVATFQRELQRALR